MGVFRQHASLSAHCADVMDRANVSAAIFNAVRIRAMAEQVNLRAAVPREDQERFRKNLADAAIKAVSSWVWDVPTSGNRANDPGWWVRMPVTFNIRFVGAPARKDPGFGDWDVYIPGPRMSITSSELASEPLIQGTDAMGGDEAHFVDAAVKLVTPLAGG